MKRKTKKSPWLSRLLIIFFLLNIVLSLSLFYYTEQQITRDNKAWIQQIKFDKNILDIMDENSHSSSDSDKLKL